MVKNPPANAGDAGSIPGLGRSPGERKCYLLQYSGLENSMDCIVHGVGKSQTRLVTFIFTFTSSILAWRIPWAEEPGGLQFMGLQRVGHDGLNELTQTTLGIL